MDFWQPLSENSPATTTGTQNLADLYEATLPLFASVNVLPPTKYSLYIKSLCPDLLVTHWSFV
jgi:hypothetical protein